MFMKVKYDNGEVDEFYAFHQFSDSVNYNNIIEIDCTNCDLILLPVKLPSSLEVLLCCMNKLTGLPYLPSSLRLLNANFNQLYTLPQLSHTNLEELYVSKNNLRVIPELPLTLRSLFISHNELESLPKKFPPNLEALYCNGNKIDQIPLSIMELKKLERFFFRKEDVKKIEPCLKTWLNRFDFI